MSVFAFAEMGQKNSGNVELDTPRNAPIHLLGRTPCNTTVKTIMIQSKTRLPVLVLGLVFLCTDYVDVNRPQQYARPLQGSCCTYANAS